MAYQGGYATGYSDGDPPQMPAISILSVATAPTVSSPTSAAAAWSSPTVSAPD